MSKMQLWNEICRKTLHSAHKNIRSKNQTTQCQYYNVTYQSCSIISCFSVSVCLQWLLVVCLATAVVEIFFTGRKYWTNHVDLIFIIVISKEKYMHYMHPNLTKKYRLKHILKR